MTKDQPTDSKVDRMPKMHVLIRFSVYAAILVALWRLASGAWGNTQGWVYIGLDVGLGVLAALWVPLTPEMEAERTSIQQGVKRWDKFIVLPLSLWYPFGLVILAGIETRHLGAYPIPIVILILAFILAIIGRLISTWAAAVNPFYGRFVRIQAERGHVPVQEGPYQFVRHPGYSGLIVFLLATGIMLQSRWTFLANLLVCAVLILRTVLEDKTLQDELEGYRTYASRVRYRLLPGAW